MFSFAFWRRGDHYETADARNLRSVREQYAECAKENATLRAALKECRGRLGLERLARRLQVDALLSELEFQRQLVEMASPEAMKQRNAFLLERAQHWRNRALDLQLRFEAREGFIRWTEGPK